MANEVMAIKDSELRSIIAQACMNNAFWEGKLPYKTADELDQVVNLISKEGTDYTEPIFGATICAIASTLGKIKSPKERKVLSFVDNSGSFICAFWIELEDGDLENSDWAMGAYFEQDELKKILEKNIKPHTEVAFFAQTPDSEFQSFLYDMTEMNMIKDTGIINRIILECLIALKFYMITNATEDDFTFNLVQTLEIANCSPEFKIKIGATEDKIEVPVELGTVKSKKTKNGVVISFTFGQRPKEYVKQHSASSVTTE